MHHDDECPACHEFLGTNPDCLDCRRVIEEDQREVRRQERKMFRKQGRRTENGEA